MSVGVKTSPGTVLLALREECECWRRTDGPCAKINFRKAFRVVEGIVFSDRRWCERCLLRVRGL